MGTAGAITVIGMMVAAIGALIYGEVWVFLYLIQAATTRTVQGAIVEGFVMGPLFVLFFWVDVFAVIGGIVAVGVAGDW